MVSFIDPRAAREDPHVPIGGVELQLFGGRRLGSFLDNLWFSGQCGAERENHD